MIGLAESRHVTNFSCLGPRCMPFPSQHMGVASVQETGRSVIGQQLQMHRTVFYNGRISSTGGPYATRRHLNREASEPTCLHA